MRHYAPALTIADPVIDRLWRPLESEAPFVAMAMIAPDVHEPRLRRTMSTGLRAFGSHASQSAHAWLAHL